MRISKLHTYKTTTYFLILSLFLVALLFPSSLVGSPGNDMERLSGSNRLETMYQVALKLSPGLVNNVVLTSGYEFADALAGIPFAHQKSAPILLVDKAPKPDSKAIQYIKDHLRVNGKVYILGGTGVITSECEKVLMSIGIKNQNIIRIAGSNRYNTALEIAKNMEHSGSEYYLVSGVDFPDALSASILAATTNFYDKEEADYLKSKGKTVQVSRGGVPIILLPSDDKTPQAIIDFLNRPLQDQTKRQTLHIIGGTGAISETIVSELKAKVTQLAPNGAIRISGSDRYHTNKNLFLQRDRFDMSWQSNGNGLPLPQIFLANGQDYPDALSGAVLASSLKAPLVLINNKLSTATSDILLDYFQRNNSVHNTNTNTKITILGGTGVVSEETVVNADYLYNYGKRPGGTQVSTYAGTGNVGSKNAIRLNAEFSFPFSAVESQNGNIYVSDTNNHLIRMIKPNGSVSTYAGRTTELDDYGMPMGGLVNGKSTTSMFNAPRGLAIDTYGNLYVADSGNGAIRKITAQGVVSTLIQGLSLPSELVFSEKGTLYVSETMKHRILEVKMNGSYQVIAGGNYQVEGGYLLGDLADGNAEEAKFNEPVGLALGANGNIYVADSGNQRIRLISADRNVTTLAGSSTDIINDTTYIKGGYKDGSTETATFNFPTGITIGLEGKIYVADSYNHAIRVITNGQVSTLAGKGIHGKQNGYLEQAQFDGLSNLRFLKNGNLLVVDQLNNLLRLIVFR